MIRHLLIIIAIFFGGCNSGNRRPNTSIVSPLLKEKSTNIKYSAQTETKCAYSNLSNQFNISVDFIRHYDSTERNDSCVLKILLKDKHTDVTIDSLKLTSLSFFQSTFSNCDSVTSYTTGFNSESQIIDNYAGDIVVADLNFDNKDDIAIINDNGGNAGPYYNYYIQDNNRKFKLNRYLTDSVTFFPGIDPIKLRLTTFAHASSCCIAEDVYQYEKSAKTWKHIKHKLHTLNK